MNPKPEADMKEAFLLLANKDKAMKAEGEEIWKIRVGLIIFSQ